MTTVERRRTISITQRDQTKPQMKNGEESTVSDGTLFYLNQIGQTTLLTAQQEVELAMKIEAGRLSRDERVFSNEPLPSEEELRLRKVEAEGEWARDELAERNLKLVVSVARRYSGRGLPLGDLIQNGNIGLLRAVEKYDYSKGFRFSTYATWWIRQSVMRSLADHSRTVRLPVHLSEGLTRLNSMLGIFTQEHGREPNLEESASLMGVSPDTLRDARRVNVIFSLDTKVNGEDNDITLGESIEDKGAANPEEIAISEIRQENIRRAVDNLPTNEREILKLRYGLEDGIPRTLEEVGDMFKVTREWIRQIERKAFKRFRVRHKPSDF